MNNMSAFEAYQASKQKATKTTPSSKKKIENTRPNFVVPGMKNTANKRKSTESEDDSDNEDQPSLPRNQPPQTTSGNKPSKKSKETSSKRTVDTTAKKQKTSKQTSRNGNLNGIEILESSSLADSLASLNSPPNHSSENLISDELPTNSTEMGCDAFKFILNNVNVEKFMNENWEKRPLYIGRDDSNYYDCLNVSRKTIDEMLRTHTIEYTRNLDVTSYKDGVRETHNPDGRAYPASVWEFYSEGCSIRLLNPQTYMPSLHKFNATLQEYFHCLVGANIYLTPPNSQGFAPHFDDIEAFVLQIEGQKEWLVYPPRSDQEKLPRESSPNFREDEIGEPKFRQILYPGDMLYFPRGWIHQARTVTNQHSLHITLSVYQNTAYADLFEIMMKQALKQAFESNVSFRSGLPLDIWNHFGQTYAELDTDGRRNQIGNHIKKLFKDIEPYLNVDDAVDTLALKYQHDALPPVLSTVEKQRTTIGTVPQIDDNGNVQMPILRGKTEVRLIRANIVRLTYTEGTYNAYYYSDNSKEYHANDLNFVEVDEDSVAIIKKLIQSYPNYVKVRDLSEDREAGEAVALSLWDRGVLMTKKPLNQ